MNFLDIILGLLLIWGLYKGLSNGLFVEIASIIALVAGLYGAIHFSYIAGEYLSKNMEWDGRYIHLTSFIITFIGIVILVSLAGKFLTKIVDLAMLGLINKIAGGIFGMLKVAVILGAFLVFLDRNGGLVFIKKEVLAGSQLYGPVMEIGAFVFSRVLQ